MRSDWTKENLERKSFADLDPAALDIPRLRALFQEIFDLVEGQGK